MLLGCLWPAEEEEEEEVEEEAAAMTDVNDDDVANLAAAFREPLRLC